jgi:hypothetical protein
MIQEFNKTFVFAYNKSKNLAFNMSEEDKAPYLLNKKTEKFELVEEYNNKKTTYVLNHIMNISGTPVFYIESEVELSTYEPEKKVSC